MTAKFMVLLAGLCLCSLILKAQVQEVHHAPTVEQCRADRRLWQSKVEESDVVRYVSYTELYFWLFEMHECKKVDSGRDLSYYNTASEIAQELNVRL